MESFQQFVMREACLSPQEFREAEILFQNPNVACVVFEILKNQAETERVLAIGAPADREAFVHLGAWKALQRAADFIRNRADDFGHMLSEYESQPIEDQ